MREVLISSCPKEALQQIKCFAGNIVDVPKSLHICQDTDQIASMEHGCFRIMTSEDGDKRVTWIRTIMAEVKAAKKMFMDLIKSGMVPYKVGINGEATAEEMTEFDPTAEEVIFMPIRAIAGG